MRRLAFSTALLFCGLALAQPRPLTFAEQRKLPVYLWNVGQGPVPLLSILPSPGAGYDSTNGNLFGTRGEAVTVSRASNQSCAQSSGAITSVASNKLCVPDGTAIHVEPIGTNLALQSERFDDVAWGPNNVASTTPTITANAADAPDGTTTADRIAYPAVGAAASSYVSQSIAASAVAYTGSVYLKATSGTPTVYVYFVTVGPAYAGSAAACTLNTSTWTRCVAANKTLTAATWFFRIGIDTRDASQATQGGGTIYAWGGQVETGAVATGYMASVASSGTRAAPVVSVTAPAGMNVNEGAAKVCVTPVGWSTTTPGTARFLMANTGSGITAALAYANVSGTANISASDSVNTTAVAAGYADGVEKCYRTSWSVARNRIRIENLSTGASADTAAFTGFGSFSANLYIGGASSATLTSTAKFRVPCVSANPDGCR